MCRPEKDRINDPLLAPSDFIEVVNYLLRMKKNSEQFTQDDIDHLGNRRVRAVGELLENQFRIGLERMERAIKRSEEHTSELQSPCKLVCRLLLEKKKKTKRHTALVTRSSSTS